MNLKMVLHIYQTGFNYFKQIKEKDTS